MSLSSNDFRKMKFDTIFFGGGTPSILSYAQIDDLLNHIHKHYDINPKPEISLEANPEDFLGKSFEDYKLSGINRLSLGVQSFINSELKFLTRQHTSDEAELTVKNASKYFDNISIDIIYSLPSQTINEIDYSLSKAIELNVNHISAYTLTFEEKTPLFKSLQKNIVKRNPENVEAEFYNFVSDKLISCGFNHYEVSNYAITNHQCRHNLKYWNYENYIGFGPSAHSFVDGIRWNNYRDIIKYNSLLGKDIQPVEEKYLVSNEQRKLEYIMLALRSSGINYVKYNSLFSENFSNTFLNSINELIGNNFAVTDNNNFKLTEKGFAVADEIIAKYF